MLTDNYSALSNLVSSSFPDPSSNQQDILRRLERWHLQAIAREILLRVDPLNRIKNCLRVPTGDTISVHQSPVSGYGFYKGLQTCGQSWPCPLCAAKITEKRCIDLKSLMKVWKDMGYDVLMLVLTVPHCAGESLHQVIEKLSKPMRLMRHRKTWKRIVKDMGITGTVRALEVTYGDNGWHVHIHLLLFVTSDCRVVAYKDKHGMFRNLLDEHGVIHEEAVNQRPCIGVDSLLQDRFTEMWESACMDSGTGKPNEEHGARLQGGEKADKYVAKWGLEHEMTKSHCKTGKKGGMTPFDFLRAIRDGKTDRDYVSLFREFAKGFRGRHQLEWSRGLRDSLGFSKERTDIELSKADDEEGGLLGKLSLAEWRIVYSNHKRGELLELVSFGDWNKIVDFVYLLAKRKVKKECGRHAK